MANFTTGSLWSDGATPPAAKVLTTGYVVGDEIFIGSETELVISATISGTSPTSVQLKIEQSMDGSSWAEVERLRGQSTLDGSTSFHIVRAVLTEHSYYRVSALRVGGDGTTALLALGYARTYMGSGTATSGTHRLVRVQSEIPAAVSTSGTGEDDLITFTIPQGSHTDYNTIQVIAAGTKTGTAGLKRLRFYCGSDSFIIQDWAGDEIDWRLDLSMTLDGASSRRSTWVAHHAGVRHGLDSLSTDDMSAGSIDIKVTGECANAADTITQELFIVEML